MMDSDDDDIYPSHDPNSEVPMDDAEEGEEGEEVEEEDDDDDVDFIIDADSAPKPTANAPSTVRASQAPSQTPIPQSTTDPRKQKAPSTTPAPSLNRPSSSTDRPGTDYPPRHTSTLDPTSGNPIHPSTNKPILSTDFDADFPTESSKPWRKPGADITDFFNYGFDEFTWASYCLKQQNMPKEVKEITNQAEQMKAFVEGIPGGGAPGMQGMPGTGVPAGPGQDMGMGQGGGMPGMPSEAQMQQMFAAMASQGMDPSSMDPNQFAQFMMGNGAAMMGGPQGAPLGPAAGGFGGGGFDAGPQQGGGGGFGGGGRGRGKGGRRGGW